LKPNIYKKDKDLKCVKCGVRQGDVLYARRKARMKQDESIKIQCKEGFHQFKTDDMKGGYTELKNRICNHCGCVYKDYQNSVNRSNYMHRTGNPDWEKEKIACTSGNKLHKWINDRQSAKHENHTRSYGRQLGTSINKPCYVYVNGAYEAATCLKEYENTYCIAFSDLDKRVVLKKDVEFK
jgi:hypothetical protein